MRLPTRQRVLEGSTAPVRIFVLLVLFALIGAAGAAGMTEGVVIDTARGLAFVMQPEGGLAAIDLDNGAARWMTASAARPLALDGGLLIAQGEPGPSSELVLVALDAATGRVHQRTSVDLPDGARALLDHRFDAVFHIAAHPRRGGGTAITWRFDGSSSGAVLPSEWEGAVPTLERRPAKDVEPVVAFQRAGAVHFDARAGRASVIEGGEFAAAGGLAEVASVRGRAVRAFHSLDGLHRLESTRGPATNPWNLYRWTVIDQATGSALGGIDSGQAASPFVVRESALIYQRARGVLIGDRDGEGQMPLSLISVDLTTGKTHWTRDIRDVRFMGPFPP